MKHLAIILSLAAAISTGVAFLFGTFPSFAYVDAKDDAISSEILQMKETLKIIDQRTWEMNGRRAPLPAHLQESPE